MKPKPQIDPNAAGLEASRLFATDEKERMTLKNMRSVKAARKEQLKQALTIVWAAFESGQTVNGYATRKEWCKEFAKVSNRTCENILYGRAPREANHGSLLTRIADAKKKLANIQRQIDAPFKDGETRDLNGLHKQINPTINPLFEEFLTLIAPEGYEVLQGSHGWLLQEKDEEPAVPKTPRKLKVSDFRTNFRPRHSNQKIHATNPITGRTYCGKKGGVLRVKDGDNAPNCAVCLKRWKSTKADPKKDLMKRFRQAKRAATFFTGMHQELTDGVDGEYEKLLWLYAEDEGRGDHRYPWTMPSKGYELPKTEKEFETQWEKAIAEFDKVLAEGKAMGVLTTEPRKKPTVAVVLNPEEDRPMEETFDANAMHEMGRRIRENPACDFDEKDGESENENEEEQL